MADIKKLNSQASKLADLINYQNNSVVSKEIIKGKNGNITVFAFDEGEGLSEHTAPFDALVHAIEGEAEIMISGKNHNLKEGEIITLPANKPHSVKAIKKFKMILVMIKS
jgi:quercetin dioxygenase-like cupin family protein